MDRNISNWGWGQLMELPDHFFGRRFMVGCASLSAGIDVLYDISELALPEKCVIWEVQIGYVAAAAGYGTISLALGDQLPVDDAGFHSHQALFPDIGVQGVGHREIAVGRGGMFNIRRLKVGVDASGRRLIMRFNALSSSISLMEVMLTVSSVPRSLPEWFG